MKRRRFFGVLMGATLTPALVSGMEPQKPIDPDINSNYFWPPFAAVYPMSAIGHGCYEVVLQRLDLKHGDYIAPARNKMYQLRIISGKPEQIEILGLRRFDPITGDLVRDEPFWYRYHAWYPSRLDSRELGGEAFPSEFMAAGENWVKLCVAKP